jgi:hypothetical protein
MPDPKRLTGTLIRIRDEGFAFIHTVGQGDFYVNVTSMRDRTDWIERTVVSFVPGEGKPGKAPPAYDVARV